jgi:glyoxylase-like metal-dependent hydrolase (beta-lactamase superfamily II)
MDIKVYTGGMAQTNAYAASSKAGWLVIDAPEGTLEFLKKEGISPANLVLTHGHWDHLWDAAAIQKEFKCPVFYHKADELLFKNPNVMMLFGLPKKLDGVKADRYLNEGDVLTQDELAFKIFHVPGHCPGSICLYEEKDGVLFGGDVLFAGTVGRTDLPGGSMEKLIEGIKMKLLPLPEGTQVYPGHGEITTIGEEKASNPFLQ